MTTFPTFARVTQRRDQPRIADVEAAVTAALEAGGLRAAVAFRRAAECKPFLFPAMGSHGGGTAEWRGSAPSWPTWDHGGKRGGRDPGHHGETPEGLPVYLDRHAAAADGILVINRVKAHTDFEGRFESGLAKMMTIGMGKHAQALAVHQHGAAGLRGHTPGIAGAMLATGRVLGALAIVENAEEAPALLEALPPDRILEREPALLEKAKAWAARLPVDTLDILLVEELGKEISGTGMDTNVIGRRGIPLHFPSDREAIAAALHLNRRRPLEAIRFAWIKNTLHLKDLLVSEALLPELRGRSDLDIDPRPVPMTFTPHGTLVSPLRPGPARPAPSAAWRDVG